MKIYLDCYPCFLRQTVDAARFAGASEEQARQALQSVMGTLQQVNADANPAEIAWAVHRSIRDGLGIADPYLQQKQESTRKALELYPHFKERYGDGQDMEALIRLAIAGNIIDFGMFSEMADLQQTADRVLSQPFAIDHTKQMMARIASSSSILYLADNAGETVFDRLLIESLPIPVTYVVKGSPVLNDAIRQDALDAGLGACTRIIDNGSDAPGTVMHSCSPAFRQVFDDADVIIAKGQANYESLSDAGDRVFCLLQVKCPIIADDIGVPVKSIVVRQGSAID